MGLEFRAGGFQGFPLKRNTEKNSIRSAVQACVHKSLHGA